MEANRLRRLIDAGDLVSAFDLLYREHRSEVAAFVRTRVARQDADDACQEVWSAVSKALPSFRFDSQPRVWILSIARHKTLDIWRRSTRHETLDSLVTANPLASLLGLRRPSTPGTLVERERRAVLLRGALMELGPEERELLELRYASGLKPAEIAQLLGLEPNTVSQRIVRLLRKLRDGLRAAFTSDIR